MLRFLTVGNWFACSAVDRSHDTIASEDIFFIRHKSDMNLSDELRAGLKLRFKDLISVGSWLLVIVFVKNSIPFSVTIFPLMSKKFTLLRVASVGDRNLTPSSWMKLFARINSLRLLWCWIAFMIGRTLEEFKFWLDKFKTDECRLLLRSSVSVESTTVKWNKICAQWVKCCHSIFFISHLSALRRWSLL